jgi:hypothetical protein
MEKQATVAHSPTLNTVGMIERTIQAAGEPIMLAELKRALPKQVMHSTLMQALGYLERSGKILVTTKGIIWTFMPKEELDALIARSREF